MHCVGYNFAYIFAMSFQLPVCGMEREIMEAITKNDVVVLCGPTGYATMSKV